MSLETMSEAIRRLEQAGYSAAFVAENGGVRCATCSGWHAASDVSVEEIVRFEGDSDPADEAILFALDCDHCGARGTYVTAYGAEMEPDDVEVVKNLIDHRRSQG